MERISDLDMVGLLCEDDEPNINRRQEIRRVTGDEMTPAPITRPVTVD